MLLMDVTVLMEMMIMIGHLKRKKAHGDIAMILLA